MDLVVQQNTLPAKIVVVILNWNGKADTLECLKSVEGVLYPNFEIVVVDNGSEDDSVAAIRENFPRVRIIETGANLGYAGGNNVGLRDAIKQGADYVLLLNNDTVVDPEIIEAFVQTANVFPDAALFGAKVYYYAEPNRIWYAGAKWIDHRSNFAHLGHGLLDNEEFDRICETDFAQGCALFVRVDALKDIGLLDEKFFLNYEEVDWSYRARKAGHKSIFVPKARVWHKVSASFGGAKSPVHSYFLFRNRLLWAKRHLSFWRRFRMWRAICYELASEFLQTVPRFYVPVRDDTPARLAGVKTLYWALIAYLKGFKRVRITPALAAKLCGMRDYVMGRFDHPQRTIQRLSKRAMSQPSTSQIPTA